MCYFDIYIGHTFIGRWLRKGIIISSIYIYHIPPIILTISVRLNIELVYIAFSNSFENFDWKLVIWALPTVSSAAKAGFRLPALPLTKNASFLSILLFIYRFIWLILEEATMIISVIWNTLNTSSARWFNVRILGMPDISSQYYQSYAYNGFAAKIIFHCRKMQK